LSKKTKWKMKKTETDKFIKSLKGENWWHRFTNLKIKPDGI
jgi:hypothetical protein